jgi:hypothetical protein
MAGRKDERFESDLPIDFGRGPATLRNVSASGVYFLTEADVKPGEALSFTLEFSSADIGKVGARCEARVVRVEPQGALRGVGTILETIEFRRVDPEPDGAPQ